MRGVISAPKKIITGAFTVLFSLQREIDFSMADISVRTLEGDDLGHAKDTIGGSGANYHLLCYIPDARKGKSRISVVKEGLEVNPVVVEYDTVREVSVVWGTPIKRGSKLEIPITFDIPIQNLKKRNFRVSYPTAFQLYGSGDAYSLVISKPRARFTVSVSGKARKLNGLVVDIQESVEEVRL